MLPPVETSQDFVHTQSVWREAVARWVQLLSREGELQRLDACDDAYAHGLDENHVYFVQAGTLTLCHEDKTLWHWTEGDLFGISHFSVGHLPAAGERLAVADFALLISFPLSSIEQAVGNDPVLRALWFRILALHQVMLEKLVGCLVQTATPLTPGFRRFAEGELILQQGDEAEYVYTIMEGGAAVLVDGVPVGEVGTDEIFGALAVLTGGRRSATVVASRSCRVMMVHRDEFFSLVKTHPQLFMALVQDMARTIFKLNDRVVDLQGR